MSGSAVAAERNRMAAARAGGAPEFLARFFSWGQAWVQRILRLTRRAPRRLKLCESLALGERRFVAVVEFEQARFLLGGTSASLVLLARLEDAGVEDAPPDSRLSRANLSGGNPESLGNPGNPGNPEQEPC